MVVVLHTDSTLTLKFYKLKPRMASRCMGLVRTIRCRKLYSNLSSILQNGVISMSTVRNKFNAIKELRPQNEIFHSDDPDTFGTLSRTSFSKHINEDEGDIREEKYLQELPLPSQKLTTKQYADLIKQYIKHKRIKEAIDVLEIRMIQEDRVKPENYIYNILIGACADVGYTKKAFKLYNDMKKRALKPTGDTYTCLFTACLNSPWVTDGLKKATHLRALMIEKGIEPNVTNYNVMIKTFGRCGDLPTAFQLVDEMVSKKIKVRVHTFNHLLQACITDKQNGLRHALVVWRKMLKMREKPNVHSFNLMLKCVKDCDLGSKEDINDLLGILEENMFLNISKGQKPLQIEAAVEVEPVQKSITSSPCKINTNSNSNVEKFNMNNVDNNKISGSDKYITIYEETSLVKDPDAITMEFVDYKKQLLQVQPKPIVPNLLSRTLQMDKVVALQDVHTVQDKFAIIGGQEEFLKEMEVYSVQPDIKIFTQMLPLIDDTTEAEMNLIEAMKKAKVKPDIDFYNLLIRKRCLRLDYEKAHEVRDMIAKESKKRHPMNKKHRLKENIMTYGVLAMTCKTKDSAGKLLDEMKEKKLKINIQILGTLLKHGTVQFNFDYIKFVMDTVKKEQVMVNDTFIQHLEKFNDKCANIIQQKSDNKTPNKGFSMAFSNFSRHYKAWLTEVKAEEALEEEHPWQQFRESYPEPVQRPSFRIEQPKKFFKRNKNYVKYSPI